MTFNSQRRLFAADDWDAGLPGHSRPESLHRRRKLRVGMARDKHRKSPIDDELPLRE
jgi:hypothetical protein